MDGVALGGFCFGDVCYDNVTLGKVMQLWCSIDWYGVVGSRLVGRGAIWQVRRSLARHGEEQCGTVRQERLGRVRYFLARSCSDIPLWFGRCGLVRYCTAMCGAFLFGTVGFGRKSMVKQSMVKQGLVRRGLVMYGVVRQDW